MEIRNLTEKDTIKIEDFLKSNIAPTNPLLEFRIFDMQEEDKNRFKQFLKEAINEVLDEREIVETYRKLPKGD